MVSNINLCHYTEAEVARAQEERRAAHFRLPERIAAAVTIVDDAVGPAGGGSNIPLALSFSHEI